MDKEAKRLLTNAKTVIQKQKETIDKMAQEKAENAHFKLAYDVAVAMQQRDMIDEAEFQETVKEMQAKTAEDLQKRASLLEDFDLKGRDAASGLNLGDLDKREGRSASKVASGSESDQFPHSPSPHTVESETAAEELISAVDNL